MSRADWRDLALRLFTSAVVKLFDWSPTWGEDPATFTKLVLEIDPGLLTTAGDRAVLLAAQRLIRKGVTKATVQDLLAEMGPEEALLRYQPKGPAAYLQRLAETHVLTPAGSLCWSICWLRHEAALRQIERAAGDLIATCRRGRDPAETIRGLSALTETIAGYYVPLFPDDEPGRSLAGKPLDDDNRPDPGTEHMR